MRAHRFLLPWTAILSVLVVFLLTLAISANAQLAASSLPNAFRLNPPGEAATLAQPAVEASSAVKGTLELVEEFSHESYRTRYFVNTGQSSVELQFASDPPLATTGAAVQARGTRVGDILFLQAGGGNFVQTPVAAPSIPLPGTLGAQSTVVILVNYQDFPNNQPYSVADATAAFFTTLNNFIKENSLNQASVTGDVFGWFTIAVNSTACDFNQIQTLADAAATSHGANLANYKHIIYAAPPVQACSWEGASTIGGSPSRAWVNVDVRTNLLALAHEFGHGLGLMHSHAESCNGTTIGNNCTVQDYGDLFDAMGNTNPMHYNGPQKERLGWLGASLTKAQSTGTFTLIPYASAPGTPGIRVLEIPAGNDPATGNPSFYYVCYRQGVGFDSPISAYPSAAKGVLIHHSVPLDLNSTDLLDANPATAWFNDAALLPGQTFTDSGAGVTITTNSADGTTASVKVTLSGPVCTQHNPTVGISPSNPVVGAGAAVPYSVTITDNDSAPCSSATYALSANVQAGFSANFSGGNSVTLSPGGSTSVTLNVTSPGNAALGSYNVSATATNGGFAGTGNATYTVGNPGLSVSASPSTVNVIQGNTGSTTITVTGSGGFNAVVTLQQIGAPQGVTATFSPTSIGAPGSGNSTLSFVVGANAPTGSWTVQVAAGGGGQSTSTNVTLNITAPTPPPPNVNPILIPQSGFKATADSEQAGCGTNSPASNAIDGNTGTVWEASFCPNLSPLPHYIDIDLGGTYNVVGLRYRPRSDGRTRGNILAFEIYTSPDGIHYTIAASGAFQHDKSGSPPPPEEEIDFNPVQATHVRLRALSDVGSSGYFASAAEINVLQQATGACVHVGPSVDLTPHQSQGVQAGTPVTFTLSVKNNDTAACSSTTFNLSASVPAGWSAASLGTGSLTLAPGVTGSTTLQVSSPASATNNFYPVTGTATSASDSSLTGSASAQYTVSNISPGDFTVGANPGSVTVLQNSSGSTTISTSLSGGFNAAVSLSVTSALPTGVTASFNPGAIAAPGGGSSTLTFNAAPGATTGPVNVTVSASGGGITHTVTVSLTVTALPPGPPGIIPQTNWKLVSVDSQETSCANSPATNAFDGKTSTIWESQWCGTIAPLPHKITIDMGATYNVSGMIYTPRQDLIKRGKIAAFKLFVSTDGVNFTQVTSGVLITDPTSANPVKVTFTAAPGRFILLEADSEANGGPFTSAAEIQVLGN
ncbi:MAG TPA: discoidin domain-containing protein [Terriglobales bacterium]|nr:discoidin domain-containing protein [Terriglobales bacterium]